MTDIVDEDLASAAGRRRASVATTTSTKSATAIATSRRSAFVASSAGCRWSGKARFGLAVLVYHLSVACSVHIDLRGGWSVNACSGGKASGTLPLERKPIYP